MKVLFALDRRLRARLFAPDDEARIARVCQEIPAGPVESADKAFLLENVAEAEIVITGWGTARMDEDVLARAARLRCLAHAAGTVKPYVSDALWDRSVRVTSAAAAIAVGVAEFCLGMILLATKRALWAGPATRRGQWQDASEPFGGPQEIHGENVGVIGAGYVGRELIRLLRNFSCRVLLYDPYCPADEAERLGARKVATLQEIFSRSLAVCLCAPATDETRGMIRGEHFRLLRRGAVFVNAARGAIVDEPEMIEALRAGTFVACLDVTDPEPPAADSPLRTLPNVWLTPHVAGAVAQNLLRIGSLVADEIEAFVAGRAMRFEVRREHLARLA